MSTVTHTDWSTRPAPATAREWIARAAEVAAVLATDAAARDRACATPYAEVRLLKDAGLVTLLGPTEHGGGGQDWTTAYRVIREVAKADGSIGQLLGYHYLWFWAARLVGTREQWEQVEAEASRNRWFFGGAVNPATRTSSSPRTATTSSTPAARPSPPAARSPTSPSSKASWKAPNSTSSPSCPPTPRG